MVRNTWNFAICESCLNNAHKEEKMIRRKVVSTDENGQFEEEYWVCTRCGSTKKL